MAQFVEFLKYVLVIGVIVALAIAQPIIDGNKKQLNLIESRSKKEVVFFF